MNWKTTLVLLLVLAGLAAVVLFTKNDPVKGFRETGKMVAGYEPLNAKLVRVENAERNEKVVLAKNGKDWEMREPVKAPADATISKFIVDYFSTYDGTRLGKVGDAQAKASELGLDKPRATVEIEGATAKPVLVKIGADDLRGNDVFLQIGDEVFRAPRTLYNSVAKPAPDFRDRRAFTLSSFDVTQVELAAGGSSIVLTKEGTEWRITAPFHGRADASAMGRLTQTLANLRIQSFENDAPGALAPYGLDPPEMTITLRANDVAQTLRVGRLEDGRTFVQRDGQPTVWRVLEGELVLARKSADEFRDPNVFGTFTPESVKSLKWSGKQGEIAIAYDGTTRKAKLTAPREADADRDAFEAAVKSLDGLKAEAILGGAASQPSQSAFADSKQWLELTIKDAAKPVRLAIGSADESGVLVRRDGDDYVLRLAAAALPFLAKAPFEFVSKELVSIDSYVAGVVELDATENGQKRSVVFKKDDSNKWTREGSPDEDKELTALADSIWHAKATEILPTDPKDTSLASPLLELRVYRKLPADAKPEDKEKERVATLRFAKNAEGAWLGNGITGAAATGGFSARVAPDLPEKIAALAFPKPASAPASKP